MLMKTPPRSAGRWTEAEISDICDRRDKESASIIAETYGVTRNAIIGIWHRARASGALPLVVRSPQQNGGDSKRIPKICAEPKPRAVDKIIKAPDGPATTAVQIARKKFAPRRYAEINCDPVSLREAKECDCRYWIGKGDDGLALFCGAKVEVGTSWCAGHAKVVFAKPNEIPEYLRRAAS